MTTFAADIADWSGQRAMVGGAVTKAGWHQLTPRDLRLATLTTAEQEQPAFSELQADRIKKPGIASGVGALAN